METEEMQLDFRIKLKRRIERRRGTESRKRLQKLGMRGEKEQGRQK